MIPVLALVALILAAGLIKEGPPLIVFGCVMLMATALKRQADKAHDELLALAANPADDPWAAPPATIRKLADRAQRIALDRMSLRSAFPTMMPA